MRGSWHLRSGPVTSEEHGDEMESNSHGTQMVLLWLLGVVHDLELRAEDDFDLLAW